MKDMIDNRAWNIWRPKMNDVLDEMEYGEKYSLINL